MYEDENELRLGSGLGLGHVEEMVNRYLQTTSELSPAEYLALSERDKAAIERVRFKPPRLGDGNFGKFVVDWKWPRHNEMPHAR